MENVVNTSAAGDVAAQTINVSAAPDFSIFTLIGSADFVGKAVMLALFLSSVWSWAIILEKFFRTRLVQQKIAKFEEIFWSGQAIDQLYERVKRGVDNPVSAIFVAALTEFKRSDRTQKSENHLLNIGSKDRIMQAMTLVRNREAERLEQNLGFLATVGSTAPFIGLFGTVWGIMHSFQSIAASKNTSLAVVAPGIAEALLATAIGLFAAIPAVVCYNYLAAKIITIGNRMDDFIGELHTILSRAIDEEKL